MTTATEAFAFTDFDQRRSTMPGLIPDSGHNRRKFSDSREELSPDAQELALAIDRYKIMHRRRYITQEELLNVIREVGYHK